MRKIAMVILSMVLGLSLARPVAAADFGGYQTSVKALALYNLSEEKLLASENAEERLPIASLAKMMTALVVLEDTELALADEVTVTSEMLANLSGWAVVGLKAGTRATVEDLLYALMLPSAGDAGQALAVATSGSIANFVELMNKKAEGLGLINTHFSNPIGRDENNYASARDVAELLIYALRNEEFRRIFEANAYEMKPLGKTIYKTVSLPNKNLIGAKTGFTYQGRSLASVARRNGVDYLLVVLDADWRTTKHIDDSLAIYKYYGENYGYRELVAEGEVLVRLPVVDAETQEYEVVATREFDYFLQKDFLAIEYRYEGASEVNRRMQEGEWLGRVRILADGEEIYSEELYFAGGVEFRRHIPEVAAVLVVSGAALAVVIVMVRKKKRWIAVIIVVVVAFGGTAVMMLLFVPGEVANTEMVLEIEPGEMKNEADSEPEKVAEGLAVDEGPVEVAKPVTSTKPVASSAVSKTNCTLGWGKLMLINPKWTVTTSWIAGRKANLVNITAKYGIIEGNSGNGTPLLDAEAAEHLNQMLAAYREAYPGHTMQTRSCFRAKGTTCGRLCYATGTSDHHTGYTCDLIDPSYGTRLNTDFYGQHTEWQWLKANSYKYGFIDRFPQEWAGGSMSQPVNITEAGSTGLYESWHYRYVGVEAATEIATGKYNGGKYDSLEHYLKASGRIESLLEARCR